jgi:hypothetical protein
MASGSESDSQRENITITDSVAPPRLPLPPSLQLSHTSTADSRPWNSSSSLQSLRRLSQVHSLEMDANDFRAGGSRHLRLPPLDTSAASHRPLSNDQLPSVALDHHPNKRRRIEEPRRGGSPNVVSRSYSTADSSRLRTHTDNRQDPVCNQSRITFRKPSKTH